MESAAGKGAGPTRAAAPHGHGHHALLPAGRAREALAFAAGAVAAALVLLGTASVLAPSPVPNLVVTLPSPSSSFPPTSSSAAAEVQGIGDGPRTFYDDPSLSYTIDRRVTGWDGKRAAWLRSRGLSPTTSRVVMVSGSQPQPCRSAGGDHLLLRFLKNKLDYCRLHGIELLYNTAHLHPGMASYWAKIPVLRAAMLAHPDAEWLWWVDADAVFTDMDFALPLADHRDHNLVLYGWPKEVYERSSWVGLNAGVFLIRNCQWSLDLMDAWAAMGPASPDYARWGKKLRAELTGKTNDESDDQSALVYLLLKNRERWGHKTFIGNEYYFQGYWLVIVDLLDGVAARYDAAERDQAGADPRLLRRRHAEREHLRYAAARNAAVREAGVPGPDGGGEHGWRRPFVTHFTGCTPCDDGRRNPAYPKESCDAGMRRALDFADDQVLRAYGFRHVALGNDSVRPLPFDYPAAVPERNS